MTHYQQRNRNKLVLTPSPLQRLWDSERRLFRYSEHAKKSLNQGSKERGDESSERLIYGGFNISTSQVVLYRGGGIELGEDLCKIDILYSSVVLGQNRMLAIGRQSQMLEFYIFHSNIKSVCALLLH